MWLMTRMTSKEESGPENDELTAIQRSFHGKNVTMKQRLNRLAGRYCSKPKYIVGQLLKFCRPRRIGKGGVKIYQKGSYRSWVTGRFRTLTVLFKSIC